MVEDKIHHRKVRAGSMYESDCMRICEWGTEAEMMEYKGPAVVWSSTDTHQVWDRVGALWWKRWIRRENPKLTPFDEIDIHGKCWRVVGYSPKLQCYYRKLNS